MTIECIVLMMVFATTSIIIGLIYVSYMYIKDINEAEQQIKEAERRAEVAERALRNITERASCNICDNFSCRYYEGINYDYNAEDCIKWWLAQAEKELAEGKKNDKG